MNPARWTAPRALPPPHRTCNDSVGREFVARGSSACSHQRSRSVAESERLPRSPITASAERADGDMPARVAEGAAPASAVHQQCHGVAVCVGDRKVRPSVEVEVCDYRARTEQASCSQDLRDLEAAIAHPQQHRHVVRPVVCDCPDFVRLHNVFMVLPPPFPVSSRRRTPRRLRANTPRCRPPEDNSLPVPSANRGGPWPTNLRISVTVLVINALDC